MLAYASRGLVGMLVPQANTTVEPELAILLPPGVASITARMVSRRPELNERLVAYFEQLENWAAQFAGAPIGVLGVACTGSSYLLGRPREAAVIDRVSARFGIPVVTSGRAVAEALTALRAERIALVSPYPPDLTQASVAYWQAHGFAVARVEPVTAAGPNSFHPVYAIDAGGVSAALRALEGAAGIDAVVILGTGLPSLQPILDMPRAGGAPVLSCLLATAWRCVLHLDGQAPSAANLLAWIDRPAWGHRLAERHPQTGN